MDGAVLKPDVGVTITLAAGIAEAPMAQIFDANGVQYIPNFLNHWTPEPGGYVVVKDIPEVYPQWWGAVADGTTPSQIPLCAAFQSASMSADDGQRAKVMIPAGEYYCEFWLLLKSNTTIENRGYLKFQGGNNVGSFVSILQQSNIEFYGSVVDSNLQTNDNAIGIGSLEDNEQCDNIWIHDVLIKNAKHGGVHIPDINFPGDVGRGGGKGITLQHGIQNCMISNVVLDNCELGLSIEGLQANGHYGVGIVINNVVVKDAKYCGLFLNSLSTTTAAYATTSSVNMSNIELVDCATGMTTENTPRPIADLFGAIVLQAATNYHVSNLTVRSTKLADKMTVFRGSMRQCNWDVLVLCNGELSCVVDSSPWEGNNPLGTTSRWNNVRAQVTYEDEFSGYLLDADASYYADWGNYEFLVTNYNKNTLDSVPVANYVNNQQPNNRITVQDAAAGKFTTVFDGTPASQVSPFADFLVNGLAIDDDVANSFSKIAPTRTNLALANNAGQTKAFVGSAFVVTATPLGLGSVTLNWGAGSPESSLSAPVGSLYLNTSGGSGTVFYVKESGDGGNTGWSNLTGPTLSVDGVTVTSYDVDTTPLTASDLDAYTMAETDVEIAEVLIAPVLLDANSNNVLVVGTIADTVNELKVEGGSTGVRPSIAAQGTDTDIGIDISAKNAGSVIVRGGSNNASTVQLRSIAGAAVNYAYVTPSATGLDVTYGVAGTDANVDAYLVTQGDGLVRMNGAAAATRSGTEDFTNKTLDLAKIKVSSGTAPTIYAGAGSPESSVTGSVGSMYLRNDGSTGTCLYIKESGTGNTGWVDK